VTYQIRDVHHGDCLEVMRSFGDRSIDVVITDPPYSPEVHGKSRAGARTLKMGNGKPTFNREVEFGFDAITPALMASCAAEFARLVRRWTLVFCDVESVGLWRDALSTAGLEPVRVGVWVKEACTPQFTGDRPAAGVEAIVIAHRKGRKQWNGGGSRAVWTHPVVQRRGSAVNDRVHTTQKPIELMLELVELFSNPGERILDAFAGSGTTGVAAVRLGREFVGIEQQEKYVATARERIEAELSGSDLHALRAGQTALFAKESA
jgi:16S rRNA G966 N2-methylase RsmD